MPPPMCTNNVAWYTFTQRLQIIQPSLEEIQNTVNQAVQYVSEIGQHIPHWTNPFPSSAQSTPRSKVSYSKKLALHTPDC